MSDLSKFAHPQYERDHKQAARQEHGRRRSGVPRWPVIALGLLVGGVFTHLLIGDEPLPDVERLVAGALDMLSAGF